MPIFAIPSKELAPRWWLSQLKARASILARLGTAFDYWLRCELRRSDPTIYTTFLGYRICIENYGGSPKVAKLLKRHTKALSEFSKGTLESEKKLYEASYFWQSLKVNIVAGIQWKHLR
jgi:hypothetical protein